MWNSDKVVHLLYKKGNLGYKKIKTIVPEATVGNSVNREVLSKTVVENPFLLKKIEKLIHPLLEYDRLKFIEKYKTKQLIVFDIPLLFETNCERWLDTVIVATAPFQIYLYPAIYLLMLQNQKLLE